MATHSSILAWEIPWTEEPGGLQSMGSQRVRHDLVTNPQRHHRCHPQYLSLFNFVLTGNYIFKKKNFDSVHFQVHSWFFFIATCTCFVSYFYLMEFVFKKLCFTF